MTSIVCKFVTRICLNRRYYYASISGGLPYIVPPYTQ